MKEEKVKYESYSVIVSEQDLNPFVDRFNREININFQSEKNISYGVKYEIECTGEKRMKTTADNKRVSVYATFAQIYLQQLFIRNLSRNAVFKKI